VHVKPGPVSYWQGLKARRLRVFDAGVLSLLALLALASVVTGALETRDLSAESAGVVADTLRTFDAPELLADARLRDERGDVTTLMSQTHRRLSLVAVPPPRGAPAFVRKLLHLFGKKRVVVIVPSKASSETIRRAFDDAGLEDTAFYVDANDSIVQSGHVTSLPMTFLIDPTGAVLHSVQGADEVLLGRLRLRYELEGGGRR
jgi:hypothetical protein